MYGLYRFIIQSPSGPTAFRFLLHTFELTITSTLPMVNKSRGEEFNNGTISQNFHKNVNNNVQVTAESSISTLAPTNVSHHDVMVF
jgi:hypothetical protein